MPTFIQNLGLGTIPQWGAFVTLLTMFVGLVTVWVKGVPERLRAKTEARKEAGERHSADYKAWREEVHTLRGELQTCIAAHRKEADALTEQVRHAESVSQQCRDENTTMRYLIGLLVDELRRHEPESGFIKQAEVILLRMAHDAGETER